jgi:radical SAM superfamily enzyme YgiQ (UPF0313 family)
MREIQETNIIKKPTYSSEYIKFALIYPNQYRAGISNYAIQLIYRLLNKENSISCERVFWEDQSVIKSIENGTKLEEFDVIGFSIQYELDYFNIVEILKKASIPILARIREKPLLIAGGPCILENPTPLSNIFDLFILGDIEQVLHHLIDYIKLETPKKKKKIKRYSEVDGFLFQNYNITRNFVKKSQVTDLDSAPHAIRQIIPFNIEDESQLGFGRSILLNCCRGCKGKCNFCLIGWQNNPYRERSLNKIIKIIDECIKVNHSEKIALIGSGISYHKNLNDLAWYIANLGYKLSIPSLRADKFDEDLAEALNYSGLNQITFAPETGSDKLRDIVNKNMSNEDILRAIKIAMDNKIEKIKLYFMIDLPTEIKEDIEGIPILIKNILNIGIKKRNLSISVNNFIPKPHTPFQWSRISNIKDIRGKIKYLNNELKKQLGIKTSFSDPKWARIQIILSRGDKTIADFLIHCSNILFFP